MQSPLNRLIISVPQCAHTKEEPQGVCSHLSPEEQKVLEGSWIRQRLSKCPYSSSDILLSHRFSSQNKDKPRRISSFVREVFLQKLLTREINVSISFSIHFPSQNTGVATSKICRNQSGSS